MTRPHPELLEAYNRDPSDLVLLRAMADELRERDGEVEAQLLDAVVKAGWVPTHTKRDGWGWGNLPVADKVVERAFVNAHKDGDRSTPSGQLIRLLEGHLKAAGTTPPDG